MKSTTPAGLLSPVWCLLLRFDGSALERSGLDSLDAGEAIHLFVEGIDLRHPQLLRQSEVEAIGKIQFRLSHPKIQCVGNRFSMFHGESRVVDDDFEVARYFISWGFVAKVEYVDGFENCCGGTENSGRIARQLQE